MDWARLCSLIVLGLASAGMAVIVVLGWAAVSVAVILILERFRCKGGKKKGR